MPCNLHKGQSSLDVQIETGFLQTVAELLSSSFSGAVASC